MKGRVLMLRMVNVVLVLALVLSGLTVLTPAQPVAAAGGLTLTIIAAPNLVVDSNALSPSTYAPKVATVIAKICNTTTSAISGVTAYIGDYTNNSPGIYPAKIDPTVAVGTSYELTYRGTYAFEHLGGTADGTRFIGSVPANTCTYQYWSFEYPHYAINDDGGATITTWGVSVKPDDDLSLNFDMWVTGNGGSASDHKSHTMYMRNEISAMANKIKPNGNPSGEWFNTNTNTVYPGQTITTNGILYRLGNINQGFDNGVDTDGDGLPDYYDGVPDYNAWIQPFGDPAYDPSCFRLVGVTGVLTVTRGSGNPDMIIPIYNNLYFTNLPPDNTDVRGEVFYEFLALGGACTVPITPYQEVASGSDNEKFNGDYGTGVPALMSYEPEVDITKTAPGTQSTGATFTYSIPFVNNSPDVPAGLTLTAGGIGVNAGLMISDTVPLGLQYVSGSAGNSVAESINSIPTGNSVTIYFSSDGGATWTTTDPGNYTSTSEADRLIIQWWLNEPLDDSDSGNNSGYVRYRATIPSSGYTGSSFIENCADASFGDAAPFDRACAITMVRGTNSIGDVIWTDEDGDGLQDDVAAETGLNGVTVKLYWDRNTSGNLDSNDIQLYSSIDVINGLLDLDGSGTISANDTGEFDTYNVFSGRIDVDGDGDTDADDDAIGLINGYNVINGYLDMDGDGSTTLPDAGDDGQVSGTATQSKSATITSGLVTVTSGPTGKFAGYDLISGQVDVNGDGAINASDTGTGLIGGFNSASNTFVLYDVTNGNVTSGGSNVTSATLNGTYGFAYLPNAQYIVEVSIFDTEIPTGYTPTTPKRYVVNLTGNINNRASDFGFGPTLLVDKYLTSVNPTYEGSLVTFNIDLTNQLPGDGTASGFCQYTVWATAAGTHDSGTNWQNKPGSYSSVNGRDNNYAYLFPANATDIMSAGGINLGLPSGTTFRRVELLYSLYVAGSFNDDTFYARFWRGATGYTSPLLSNTTLNTYGPGMAMQATYAAWDITTGFGTWAATDFNGTTLEIGLDGGKGGGSGDTTIYVDAMGFRVTTNELCGSADTTIATLPLADNYDAARLEFVSASPAQSSVTTGGTSPYANTGTINWANLGPLYAGGTKTAQVTFRALDPAAASASTTNYASVTNSYFGNGRRVNDDDDSAPVTINATGSIAGTVWSEGSGGTTGWVGTTGYENLGTTDFAIPGVTVNLYGCYTTDPASGGTLVTTPNTAKRCDQQGNWYLVPNNNTQTTDANGYYKFSGLRMGFYRVNIPTPLGTQTAEAGANETNQNPNPTPPTGHNVSGSDQWGDNSQNLNESYYNPIGTLSGGTLTSPNEDITNINFGYSGVPARIAVHVYTDSDGDGTQDSGEANRSNVTVGIYADTNGNNQYDAGTDLQVGSSQLTDANGNYTFSGLSAGSYFAVVTQPANTTQTDDPDSTGTCTTCDNRTTTVIALSAGETEGVFIFGYQPSGSYSLGDTIYYDWDGDGTQGTGELGMPNITVYLYEDEDNDGVIDTEDALIDTTETNSSGTYTFGDLPTGFNYIVVVNTSDLDFPAGLTQTDDPDNSGACSGSGCDSRSTSAAISGADDLDNDFGYQPRGQGQIGDYVWLDTNGDGVQDANESGQPNVIVNLYHDVDGDGVIDTDDALIATANTIGYNVINGYIDFDGDGNSTSPDTDDDITNLFGYRIVDGGVDLDGDGTISGTDDGYFGAYRVVDGRLDMNGNGSVNDTDDGNLRGYYLFINLPSGDYQGLPADDYIVQIAPAEFSTGGDLVGLALTNVGADYDATQVSRAVNLDPGEKFYEADFGFASSAIGDFVWLDSNGDGLWANGEVGIEGVVVELYLDANNDGVADGTAIATTTTNSDGLYLFGGLAPNNYIVKVADSNFTGSGVLVGYTLTGDPDSWNDADPADPTEDPLTLSCLYDYMEDCDGVNWLEEMTDKDGDPLSPRLYGLQPGQNDMSSDFGYQPPALIGDFIWQDLNGDGVQDPGEPGIPDVDVFLCASNSPCEEGVGDYIATATTNDDGYYYFTGYAAGTYVVTVDTYDLLAGMTQTGDPEYPDATCSGAECDDSGNANTIGNVSDLDMDFGYQGSAVVAGTVFFDIGSNGGLYGSGDVPFPGVPVYLYDSTGALVGSTLTDANGHYVFNVATGTYTIRVGQVLSTRVNGMTLYYEPDDYSDDQYCFGGSFTSCDNATTVNTSDLDAATQDFGYFAAIDMGDLPEDYNYTITMGEEGPIHINNSGGDDPTIYLGLEWDSELDGAPDDGAGMNGTPATGDDLVGDDDEDGVEFLTPWYQGQTAQLRFTIVDNDSTYKPYLVGWFDWNNDGDFYDDGEMRDFGNLAAGQHTFDIPIPATAPIGPINMRFRLYATQSPPPVIAPTGTVVNGEVEDYQQNNDTPTAITLASFEATPQDEAILVTWETAMELDNVGFNLYRSTAAAGPYTQLNATLIPPQFPGEVMGGYYEWLDTDVLPGVTYFYKLEDIDVKGVSTFNGPISTTVATAPTAVHLQSVAARAALLPLVGGVVAALGLWVVRRRRR